VADPNGESAPDPTPTSWVGRAKPLPPPTDPYWPPIENPPIVYYEPAVVLRPARRRRTGRTIAIVLSSLFLLCCGGGAVLAIVLNGGLHSTAAVGSAPPGLNTPVQDGRFEFVVTAVNCGQPTVGRSIFTTRADGQYCVVDLSVRNIGTKSQSFADGFQKLIGEDGNVYSANTAAGLAANESATAVWNVINPGMKVTGKMVYDVPKQTHIVKVELHDSPFSHGVTITL
jgi:hypothetical protein